MKASKKMLPVDPQWERRYGQHHAHAGPNSIVSRGRRENLKQFDTFKTRTLC